MTTTAMIADIRQADTPALRAELARALTLTAQQLTYLAAIWRELEHRGEDLSALRSGIASYLPQIAAGTLDAEIVVRYAGQKMLIAAVGRMPIERQRLLAEAGHIAVAHFDDGGQRIEVDTPLHRLAASDIRIAFGELGPRSTEDQFRMLTKPKPRSSRVTHRKARRVCRDPDDGDALLVGSASVSISRLLPLLSEYFGVDIEKLLREQK